MIKPNLIRESRLQDDDWEYVITHPNVISAVVRWVYKALNGVGEVIIADGPQTDSDFEKIAKKAKLYQIEEKYREKPNFGVEIFDLREEKWITEDNVIVDKKLLTGDPKGYTEIDLGESSEFKFDDREGNYYGAAPDYKETQRHHSSGHHRYRVARSALEADLIINLPKLKKHKKAGVTLSLKNLVGIHGNRNYLPHHTMGTPEEGGDEFAHSSGKDKVQGKLNHLLQRFLGLRGIGSSVERAVKKLGYYVFGQTQDVVRSGNWYGNDTVWRMILDLNKILFYATPKGEMRTTPQCKYLTIVDGIVGGEGKGPMSPDPKPTGLLIGGLNPVAVDTVAATLMGFAPRKIPTLANSFRLDNYTLADFAVESIKINSNEGIFDKPLNDINSEHTLDFEPHFGWKDHIEL